MTVIDSNDGQGPLLLHPLKVDVIHILKHKQRVI